MFIETPKRLARRLRKFYHTILRQAMIDRPACALTSSLGTDDDGYVVVRFHCLNHDATWAEYIEGGLGDTPFKATRATTGYSAYRGSGCPIHASRHHERPPEEAQAEPEPPEEVRDEIEETLDEGETPCDFDVGFDGRDPE